MIKDEIYKYISTSGYVSFADLARRISGFNGDYEMALRDDLLLWSNMSEEATNALIELQKENKIEMEPCSAFIYLVDGMSLRLPVATSHRPKKGYKKRHWLPVTFSTPELLKRNRKTA